MPALIRDRSLVADRWPLLRDAATLADVPPEGPVIVPLDLWLAERAALRGRGDVGVWLAPADDPARLAGDVAWLPVIAVDFPQFTDGRGYSTARLLRQRYGYANELRAVGDVLRDQLFALAQVGFDAFALRADQDAQGALTSFGDFDTVYAATASHPAPWFRRRQPPRVSLAGAPGRAP
jgi:uncharacterized protein (DUF934 family)